MTVTCSIVGSRFDYCNALFAGMSKSKLSKLQRVQHTLLLLRVVLRRGKCEHITYIHELIPVYEHVRTLRSSSKHLLCRSGSETVLSSRGSSLSWFRCAN